MPVMLSAGLSILGVCLLLGAQTLSAHLPNDYAQIAYYSDFVLWMEGTLFFIVRYGKITHSKPLVIRSLLTLAIFSISAFPFPIEKFRLLTSETLSLLGLVCCIGGLAGWKSLHPTLGTIGRIVFSQQKLPPRLCHWGLAGLFLGITVFLSWHCFHFLPAYPDSTAQYIHGKFVAAGHLAGISSHPLREFFPVWLMVNNGRWYAQYEPLHELLLGLGHIAGTPWLINPLEGALTVAAIYALTRRISDEASARLAALLAIGCQFMLFMSAEYMNHVTALLFATLFILCYVCMLQASTRHSMLRWAIAAGLCIGAVGLTRPLSAIGVGLAFGIYALHVTWQQPKRFIAPFDAMACIACLCAGLALWFNVETTGSVWMFPTSFYHSSSLGSAMGYSANSSIFNSLFDAHNSWVLLNQALFEWGAPCSFFVMLLCLLPLENSYIKLLLAFPAAYTFVNLANQFNSAIFGPRYFYEMTSALIILTALGIRRLPVLLKAFRCDISEQAAWGIAILSVMLLFGGSMLYGLPSNLDKYSHNYMDNHPQFYTMIMDETEKPAIVFIGAYSSLDKTPHLAALATDKYRWVAFANPPSENAPVIFAYDLGLAADQKLIRYYPKRHVYYEYYGQLIPADAVPPGTNMMP